MDVFNQMSEILVSQEAFKDNCAVTISQEDFDQFLKEFIFEKLKGQRLGESFAKKFGIHDRILYMITDEKSILTHIKYCQYVK